MRWTNLEDDASVLTIPTAFVKRASEQGSINDIDGVLHFQDTPAFI